ncbi:hypothetical protein LTR12_003420 [Friedmanniomyces endolithicus]|nr:hypothetical protein LTR74_002846 [Friedmanniomyces endolithicus]KAK1822074.1 hypothetical protein LTR12_003420 [Friedmanniomyces endolithicus]
MADSTRYQKLEPEADGAEPTHDAERPRWYTIDALRQRPDWAGWLRLGFEVVLVLAVLGMGTRLLSESGRGYKGPNDPRKNFGFVDSVFMNESKYANEAAFADPKELTKALAEWLPLSSKGRGYVRIPEDERATLDGPPYLLNPLHRPHMQETYMVSGLHQLHCLSTIMASYAKIRQGEDESHLGFHIAHCFDYIRQGILCAGDATLEGNNSMKYPGVEIPWGTSHRCADWSAIVEWADERTIWPFPPGMDIL